MSRKERVSPLSTPGSGNRLEPLADTEIPAGSEGDGQPADGADVRLDSRLVILQEIGLALHSTLEPSKLIELILDSCIRYTGATTGSFILMEDNEVLRIVAARGLGADVSDEVTLRVGEGITGWVAEHGQPLNVPDVRRDSRYVMVKQHIRSGLAVPMNLNKRVVGVISVDSSRPENFDDDDLQLLVIVATQAAQVLQNARAYSDLRRSAQQHETMLEISQVMGSALDFEELFEKVMEILSAQRGMKRGFLALAQEESDELAIDLAYGLSSEEMAKGRYQKGEGIIGRVFRTGEPIGVRDVRQEPAFLGRTGAVAVGDEPVAFLACPILLEGETVGVLAVAKVFQSSDEFNDDLGFLEILANTLSQAVKIYRGVAKEKAKLLQENQLLREELGTRYKFDDIVGGSPAMQRVFSVVSSVARTRSTVLIRGDSGTGKELIAHAIHYNSPRADRPFVRVNCAAIPEHLLEPELFGHVKGSFTGAVADRKGKFVLADGGTIFLDEIGDMSPLLQAKILRVLQEREVEVVGSEDIVRVDVRIIAATHQNLEALIEAGKFREDLYYRLNVVPIMIPPLAERPEDIRLLSEHFLEKFRDVNDFGELTILGDSMRCLLRYSWPGNVRQLENVIERAAVLCEGNVIRPSDLPDLTVDFPRETKVGTGGAPQTLTEAVDVFLSGELGPAPNEGGLWDETLAVVEERLIRHGLEKAGGVQLRAAEVLGIHRNTLRKKIGQWSESRRASLHQIGADDEGVC